MRKHITKILGLSLMAALGLMAFTAVGAQAEVSAKVLVLHAELEASVTATGLLGRLLVPALKLEIHCEKSTVPSGTVLKDGIIHIVVLFELCLKIFKYNTTTGALEEELSACLISNGGEKHHITATFLLRALLHKGVVYGIAEGTGEEKLFTEVKFKECAVTGAAVKIKGTYGLEVTQGEQVELLLTPGSSALQTLLGTALKFGANPAFIDEGVAHATLTGAHLGCKWGAV
jgi:hypothetical protein